ncbi:MAG: glycosyltransferase, partial [Muribaculaceae bacterium]|nr:glycosyltransferase [Muribaculaceae bacterium]
MTEKRPSRQPGLLSVIIPIYKVEQYLKECVDSVLAQTYPNMEIILVDDGTPDRSGEIADEYARLHPDKIRVIHKENGGLSSARNAGLDIARGEFIGFVDSDDAILPEYYADMIEAMERTGADTAGSAQLVWNEPRDVVPPLPEETVFTGPEALIAFFERRVDSASYTRVYRRSLIGDTRFVHGIINEDMPFLTEIYLRAKRVVYLPKGYYLYRVTPGSITNFFKPSFFDCLD